eukprot:gene19438-23241_t
MQESARENESTDPQVKFVPDEPSHPSLPAFEVKSFAQIMAEKRAKKAAAAQMSSKDGCKPNAEAPEESAAKPPVDSFTEGPLASRPSKTIASGTGMEASAQPKTPKRAKKPPAVSELQDSIREPNTSGTAEAPEKTAEEKSAEEKPAAETPAAEKPAEDSNQDAGPGTVSDVNGSKETTTSNPSKPSAPTAVVKSFAEIMAEKRAKQESAKQSMTREQQAEQDKFMQRSYSLEKNGQQIEVKYSVHIPEAAKKKAEARRQSLLQ